MDRPSAINSFMSKVSFYSMKQKRMCNNLICWMFVCLSLSIMSIFIGILQVNAAEEMPKSEWANIDTVMVGDFFRAADVAYRDFLNRFPNKKIEDYNIGVGHGSDGILVVFQLRFSDTRSRVLGGSFIDYWIDEKTYTIKRVNYAK